MIPLGALRTLGLALLAMTTSRVILAAGPTSNDADATHQTQHVRDPLPAWADASFRPISDDLVADARNRLRESLANLDALLRTGTEANRDAWRGFLRWSELESQLDAESPDPRVLGEILAQYLDGAPGLELPRFVQVRESLTAYRRLVIAHGDDNVPQLFQNQLAEIQRDLDSVAANQGNRTELAARLEWMDELGQARDLVATTRERYSRPNLLATASAETVARGFSEPISQETRINEMILGTHICGTAHTDGHLSASLLPSQNSAVIQLTLTGTTHANTVGRQKPVTIISQSATHVVATKQIVLDSEGLRSMGSRACCTTDSQICSIRPDGQFAAQLITNIAWKKARQQQPRAEQISSRRAERRVERQLDDQTADRLSTSNADLKSRVRVPLVRRNIFPRRLKFSTTADQLQVEATQARSTQLSAATTPPTAPPAKILIQVHESLVLNSAVNAIGGMTITDERAEQLVREATGNVPEGLQVKQDEEPWSITFDLLQPLSVSFHDQQVTIAIRGRRFTRGEQEVRKTTQIAATYDIVSTDNGRSKLVRRGDVEVTYPDNESDRLSLTELRNKTFLVTKFDGLFKPELASEEISLPEQWSKLSDLVLQHISANNGWLTFGWN